MKYYKFNNWYFANNKKRKKSITNKGKHPALVVGQSNDNKKLLNIGLTSSKKRGHHKNLEISNPINWEMKSYLRDDVSLNDRKDLEEVLKHYRLNPKDKDKVIKIIDKYKKKNSH